MQKLGYRYYDASTGRFLSRDPIQDGYNWYVYCDNDPVNPIDPTGLKTFWDYVPKDNYVQNNKDMEQFVSNFHMDVSAGWGIGNFFGGLSGYLGGGVSVNTDNHSPVFGHFDYGVSSPGLSASATIGWGRVGDGDSLTFSGGFGGFVISVSPGSGVSVGVGLPGWAVTGSNTVTVIQRPE